MPPSAAAALLLIGRNAEDRGWRAEVEVEPCKKFFIDKVVCTPTKSSIYSNVLVSRRCAARASKPDSCSQYVGTIERAPGKARTRIVNHECSPDKLGNPRHGRGCITRAYRAQLARRRPWVAPLDAVLLVPATTEMKGSIAASVCLGLHAVFPIWRPCTSHLLEKNGGMWSRSALDPSRFVQTYGVEVQDMSIICS